MEVPSAIIFALLLVACNGCEMHRRMMARQRAEEAAAEERLKKYGRAALRRAQDQVYEDVRQSIYGSSSYTSEDDSGYTSYPVTRTNYLPAGTRFCPGSSKYYCSVEATCIPGEGGTWKCQYQAVASYRQPTVTRTQYNRFPVSSTRRRQPTQYFPYRRENTYGSTYRTYTTRYTCSPGLERVNITERRFKCVDIDECESEDLSTNQCQQTCVNTHGSYYCTCETGYKKEGSYNCSDKNECEEIKFPNSICVGGATCVNTEGSYECVCYDGYRKDEANSKICREIDECKEDDPCEADEICFNTFGSYECNEPVPCPEGYQRSNATGDINSDCTREAAEPDDPNSPDFISYKRFRVDAKKRRDSLHRLASLTFTGGNEDYTHHFTVRELEGGEYFWNRRKNNVYRFGDNTLHLDIFNRQALEAGVTYPYTLLITNRMYPKRRTFTRRRYQGEYGRYYDNRPSYTVVTTKRKVVMEMVPMSHDMAQDDDEYDY